MKPTLATLAVKKKASKAVDVAENSMGAFTRVIKQNASGLEGGVPSDSKIKKAEKFVKGIGGKRGGFPGVGILGTALMFPVVLGAMMQGSATATPDGVLNEQYGGDEQAMNKDLQADKRLREEGLEKIEETGDDKKEWDQNAGKELQEMPQERTEPSTEDQQEQKEEVEEEVEEIEASEVEASKDEIDVDKFKSLTDRFKNITEQGSVGTPKSKGFFGKAADTVKEGAANFVKNATFGLLDFTKKKPDVKKMGQEVVQPTQHFFLPAKTEKESEDGTKVKPKEKLMEKEPPKLPPLPGEMDTEGEDFAALTAVSALEGGDDQSRADVAQSIYNRQADGTYGDSIKDVVTADGQYQPAYKDPTVSSGPGTETAQEWKDIKDRDSAVKAMVSYYEKRDQRVTKKQMEELYDKTAAALQNPENQKSAAEHVEGRTEFLGGEVEGDDVVDRGGIEDNAFFQEYGSGEQMERGAVENPLLRKSEMRSSTDGSSSTSVPPEQYASYEQPTPIISNTTYVVQMPTPAANNKPVRAMAAPEEGGGAMIVPINDPNTIVSTLTTISLSAS